MDFSRLKAGDWVIAVSAVVLFVSSFLKWFTGKVSGMAVGKVSISGWDVDGWPVWVGLPVLIGLAMLAVVALRAYSPQTELPRLPVSWGRVLLFGGLVAAGLIFLKFLVMEDASLPGLGVEIDVGRGAGIWLALLAAIGLAVGGYLKWREETSGASTTPPTPF